MRLLTISYLNKIWFRNQGSCKMGKPTRKSSTNVKPKSMLYEGPLLVTILSGFLGAGKTSLLKHILETNDHKKKIAVIVNDMAEINIDASLISSSVASSDMKNKTKMISLQNGCICCSLREDLVKEIYAIKQMKQFEYLIVESTGIAEPQQVAESFCADFETGQLANDPSKALYNVAKLDTCVTVVDAHSFPQYMHSLKAFQEEFSDGAASPMLAENDGTGQISGEGEKNIGHLLVEQVEFANVIILNKTDLVSPAQVEETKVLIRTLNPMAEIVTTEYGKVSDLRKVVHTDLFNLDLAKASPGWLVSLYNPNHTTESDEYGVSSFVYRSRKPFHPDRLNDWVNSGWHHSSVWIKQKKLLCEEGTGENATDEIDKLNHMYEEFGNILRSKGPAWIAGRDSMQYMWAQTGRLLTLAPMMPWYILTPESQWGMESDDEKKVVTDRFVEKFGDRRQEIVFIGTRLKKDTITNELEEASVYKDPLPKFHMHLTDPSHYAFVLRPKVKTNFVVSNSMSLVIHMVTILFQEANTNDHEQAIIEEIKDDVDVPVNNTPSVDVWLDFLDPNGSLGKSSSTKICSLQRNVTEQQMPMLSIMSNDETVHSLRLEEVYDPIDDNSDDTNVNYEVRMVAVLSPIAKATSS
jgi:G3E family GTPase